MDAQGRVVLPPILRESAAMTGEVVVSTRLDYLEVWNLDRLDSRFSQEPFSEEDFAYLSEKGI
jgi:MraZ protein